MLRVGATRIGVAGRLATRWPAPTTCCFAPRSSNGNSSLSSSRAATAAACIQLGATWRTVNRRTLSSVATTSAHPTTPAGKLAAPSAAATPPATAAAAEEAGAPFSATPTPLPPLYPPSPVSLPSPHVLIRRLNTALSQYPLESLASLALLEGLSFTLTKAMFTALDVHFSTLFAVAFVLSMPLRRSMVPKLTIALPLTLVLKRLAPSLTQVHLSAVWKNRNEWAPKFMHPKEKPTSDVQASPATATAATGTAAGAAGVSEISIPARIILKLQSMVPARFRGKPYQPLQPTLMQRMATLGDQYGLALLISYRLAGCVLVNGVYLLLAKGVDVTPLLQFFGYTGDVTQVSAIGSYAGAVVFASAWFPLTVFLAPFPAQLLWRTRRAIFGAKKNTPTGQATGTPMGTAAAAVDTAAVTKPSASLTSGATAAASSTSTPSAATKRDAAP